MTFLFYRDYFCFPSHLSVYLQINKYYTVCKSLLFKITLGIYVDIRKNYKKYCILLHTISEMPLFLIKNGQLFSSITNMVISRMINRSCLQKKLYPVVTFVASSLVSFFDLLFSKYELKILATFLASSRDGWKCK